MLIFPLHSTSDDWPSDLSKNVNWNAKKWKRPLSHWKIKGLFLDYVQLLMIGQAIWAKCWLKCKKNKKGPLSHWKIKCSFLDYIQLLMISWAIQAKMLTDMQKNEKGLLSHWKIKGLFLDYVQLLMIGQAIWAKNVDWNANKQKRPPKSSKNKMFIFGLHSTSDDQPSNPSKKMSTEMLKTEKAP